MKITETCPKPTPTKTEPVISAQAFVKSLSPGSVFRHKICTSYVYLRLMSPSKDKNIAATVSTGAPLELSDFDSDGASNYELMPNATLVMNP